MICQGFPSENYDLFALGVLDEADANGIRDHVRQGCDQCHQALQTSLSRVSEMALVVPQAEPPRALRRRIIASVKPSPAGWRAWVWSPAFAVAAASIGLAIGLAAAWILGFARRPENIVAELKSPPVVVSPEKAPTIIPPQVVPPDAHQANDHPENQSQFDAAKRDLIEARNAALASASAANRELDLQRQAAAKLESDLRAKDQQLAAARNDLAMAETRNTLASKDTGISDAQQKQLASFQLRVTELTAQVASYQAALQRQKTDVTVTSDLASVLSAPSLRLVDLRATEQGGTSNARALLVQNGRALLFASQLPALGAGRVYQLWLMRGQAPAVVSGGVFRPGNNHEATLEIGNAQMLSGITGLTVTEEPLGGSPLPTGHKILIGLART